MLNGKIAVITGASSGIGRALAEALSKEGMLIYLLGRDKKRLKEVAKIVTRNGSQAKIAGFDLTNGNEVKKFAADFKKRFKVLDLLIHSAGAVKLGHVEKARLKDFDLQYKVNLRAPFQLTQVLLEPLKNSKSQIIFINSGSGLRANANWSQYAASKHGLKALADSLRHELSGTSVRVVSFYPGRTATTMQEKVRKMENADYNPKDYIQVDDFVNIIINSIKNPSQSAANIKVGLDGIEDYNFG